MDGQREKLDKIMDLVKQLDDKNRLKQAGEPTGYKKIIPFIMVGIVCLAGYGTYQYQRVRRKR